MRLLDELLLVAVSINAVAVAVAVVVSLRTTWSILNIAGLCDVGWEGGGVKTLFGCASWQSNIRLLTMPEAR